MNIDVIITHPRDLRPLHSLSFLMGYWREAGYKVRVVQALSDVTPAEIGFIHIDLTRVGDDILKWVQCYPIVVNQNPGDISKRKISSNLVSKNDDYAGPVIIKTDLNRGGKPEMHRDKRWYLFNPASTLRREIARRGGWRQVRELPPGNYPILDHKDDVPDWVWARTDLVVEKFLPERKDGIYVSRMWLFLGDREYGRLETNASPIGRRSSAIDSIYDPEIPDVVRQFRRDLGMDFGKIDWTYSEQGVVVFDANRTPSRVAEPIGRDREVMMDIAEGIESFAKAGS